MSPTYLCPTYDYLLLELTEGNFDFSNCRRQESNRNPVSPIDQYVMYQANQACWQTAFESDYICADGDKWQVVTEKFICKYNFVIV